MIERLCVWVADARRTAKRSDAGFTLIELLVVVIILGILSAVVVFAVRGVGDKGRSAASAIDARTVRTAQETFCAKNGRYANATELVPNYLASLPTLTQTGATYSGPAGQTPSPGVNGYCYGGQRDPVSGGPDYNRAGFYLVSGQPASSGSLPKWQVMAPPIPQYDGNPVTGAVNDSVVGMSFFGNQNGVVDFIDALAYTGDGGKSWGRTPTPAPASSYAFSGSYVKMVSPTTGWLTGGYNASSQLLKITNGGQTLTDCAQAGSGCGTGINPAAVLNLIDCAGPGASTCWVIGSQPASDPSQPWITYLAQSTDGGVNWSENHTGETSLTAPQGALAGSSGCQYLGSLQAVTVSFLVVGGYSACRSIDGGTTWSYENIPDPNGNSPAIGPNGLSFVPSTCAGSFSPSGLAGCTGFAAGEDPISDPQSPNVSNDQLWKTTDGGATWNMVFMPQPRSQYPELDMVSAADKDHVISAAKFLYATVNGGRTTADWGTTTDKAGNLIQIPTQNVPYITWGQYIDPTHAWVIAQDNSNGYDYFYYYGP